MKDRDRERVRKGNRQLEKGVESEGESKEKVIESINFFCIKKGKKNFYQSYIIIFSPLFPSLLLSFFPSLSLSLYPISFLFLLFSSYILIYRFFFLSCHISSTMYCIPYVYLLGFTGFVCHSSCQNYTLNTVLKPTVSETN